ncbi:MAG: efflux RND transporter periplasmic adaptor subunit [Terriglobia bacterium]
MGQTTELGLGKVEEELEEIEPRKAPPARKREGMKRWKKTLLLSLGAVALIGLVVGGIVWSKRGVVTVQTGKVVKQELSSVVSASGQIRPPSAKFANVNANTYGKITEIFVKEGDPVKKGQILLKTESVQQEADVDAQQAALKTQLAEVSSSEAGVQSSAASLKSLQADLQTAQANFNRAKEDWARAQQLLSDRLIAQQLYDQRRSDFEVAQANVLAAEAHVVQAKAQYQQITFNRDMSRARVAQNRAALVRVNDLRAKTIYASPLDGIVTALPVHAGENVVPGIQNSPGSLLYQVSDLSTITAEIKVDETEIVNVKLGQPAEVTIDAVRNKTFKGHVTEIGQSAVGRTSGLTSGQSSTTTEEAKDFKVVVTLDEPPPGLRPGLSTTAKITTATRQDAVAIPIQALAVRMRRELEEADKDAKGKAAKGTVKAATPPAPASSSSKEKDKGKEEVQGVFVLKDGLAVFTPVETGIMGPTDMEVLSGVKPGEEIVTGSFSVLRTLKSNTKVKVDNSAVKAGGPGA